MACNKITPHLDLAELNRIADEIKKTGPYPVHIILGSAQYQRAISLPSDRNAPMMAYQGVPFVLNEHLPPHYAVAEMSDGAIVRVA